MINLKPCPFCGSPAYSYHDNCIDFAGVKCDLGGCVCADILITENNWNTRPIEDALNARIAELEKDLSNKEIEYTDLWDDALALQARIAELEADNKKAFDLVRKLRMYCIWANWDNPDTEDEFNEFDVEVCKWLSKFMESAE